MRFKNKQMTKPGEQIKVDKVIFEDVTIYSRTDKVRDKRKYEAVVNGISIVVSNTYYGDGSTSFRCEDVGIGVRKFTNKDISFEVACKAAIREVVKKLEETLNILKS